MRNNPKDETKEKPGNDKEKKLLIDLESLPVSTFATDRKGIITAINSRALAFLNESDEKIIGVHLDELFPEMKNSGLAEWMQAQPLWDKHWKNIKFRPREGVENLQIDLLARQFKNEENIVAGAIFIINDPSMQSDLIDKNRIYEMAVSQSIDGIAMVNMEGKIRFVNRAWTKMHGWDAKELIGKHLSIFHDKEQLEREVKPFNEVVMNEGASRGRVGHIRKDGSSFSTYMSSTLIRNEQNEAVGMIGIARDITELMQSRRELEQVRNSLEERVRQRTGELSEAVKKLRSEIADRFRAQKALQESLQTSAEIINSIPSGLVIFQFIPPDRLVFVEGNPVAEKLTKMNLNKTRGKNILDFWPDVHMFGLLEIFANVVKTGMPYVNNELFYDDDRVDGIYDVRAFPMTGNRLGIVFNDVTDRKRAKRALLESETRFRSIFSGVEDAIYLSSLDGVVLDANPAASRMTGYKHEELVGIHAEQLVPEDAGEKIPWLAKKIKKSGGIQFEGLNVTKDGKEFPVEMSFTNVMIEDKDRVVVICRDISERKKLEIAYRQKAEEAELYNDILTHDIGNIGQTNLTYMNLLLSEEYGSINDEQRSFLEACQRQTRRCSVLVDRIRTIKYATMMSDNILSPIDLSEVLSGTIRAFDSQEHDKQVRIDFQPVQNATIMTDSLVYQLFVNLLDNTVKHCKRKTAEITIKVDQAKEKGDIFWQVIFEDNGMGIEDDLKEVIFNRFETGGKRKGTGLGLAIVKALVKKYNGKIRVEDKVPGDTSCGSRFVILLPKAPD